MIFDENGNPVDYQFIDVNPAFEKHTGLKKENVIGRKVKDILPRTESYWINTYGKVAVTGELLYTENFSVEFDKYYAVLSFKVKENHVAQIFSNITEVEKTSDKLKELNATKDKLFSLIAHDLRSPFVNFLSITEYIMQEYESFSREELLLRIYKNASSVYALLENLLN